MGAHCPCDSSPEKSLRKYELRALWRRSETMYAPILIFFDPRLASSPVLPFSLGVSSFSSSSFSPSLLLFALLSFSPLFSMAYRRINECAKHSPSTHGITTSHGRVSCVHTSRNSRVPLPRRCCNLAWARSMRKRSTPNKNEKCIIPESKHQLLYFWRGSSTFLLYQASATIQE